MGRLFPALEIIAEKIESLFKQTRQQTASKDLLSQINTQTANIIYLFIDTIGNSRITEQDYDEGILLLRRAASLYHTYHPRTTDLWKKRAKLLKSMKGNWYRHMHRHELSLVQT